MPTYVYETIPSNPKQTPRRFEVEQRMSAPALTTDPETGLPVRRVISGGLGFIGAADKCSAPAPCGLSGGCGAYQAPRMPAGGGHCCGPDCAH